METVTLKLPPKLLTDAARVASGQDVTIGHLVRVLLAKEVDRRLNPKTPMRADEALLAALQALLARDMAEAMGWADLAARLRPHGYDLRPSGGGITLHKISCGTRVCKGSELGFAYRTLVERFRAAMPGHPRGTLDLSFPEVLPDAKPLTSTEKGRLQRSLEPLFKTADDWNMLITRLARRHYEVRPHGSGLALYATPQGRHICNTAMIGYSYRALVKRFGMPMPGHPQGATGLPAMPEQEGPAFEVIERG
ncbi:MAG: hypothetical protein AB8B60_00245 [Sulfitobacter sp.]